MKPIITGHVAGSLSPSAWGWGAEPIPFIPWDFWGAGIGYFDWTTTMFSVRRRVALP